MALEWCKVCQKTMEQSHENRVFRHGKPIGLVCRACFNASQNARNHAHGRKPAKPCVRSPAQAEKARQASRDQYADPEKREKLKVLIAARRKIRLQEDPVFALATNLRSRINYALKSGSLKYYDYLGCTGAELRVKFEALFEPGMTWENWGKHGWEIDHIVGLATAKSIEDVLRLNHFSNLRPLWKDKNRQWRKSEVIVAHLPVVLPDVVAMKTSKLRIRLARFQKQLEACPFDNRSLRQGLQTDVEGLTGAIELIEQLLAKSVADSAKVKALET